MFNKYNENKIAKTDYDSEIRTRARGCRERAQRHRIQFVAVEWLADDRASALGTASRRAHIVGLSNIKRHTQK